MPIYETSVRTIWSGMMRVAEARVRHADSLGEPLGQPVSSQQPPVLLVPGYGNRSASMGALEKSLVRDGFRATTISLPADGYGDAMADARTVLNEVHRISAATGSPTVDVVGHSRGGLVARAARQLLGDAGSIGRVVTLSSANEGMSFGKLTPVINVALPDGMQQIVRGTELIDQLHETRGAADERAVGTKGFDGLLVPPSAARIEGAPFDAVDTGRSALGVSGVGHYGVLRDDRAYEAIRGALLAQPR